MRNTDPLGKRLFLGVTIASLLFWPLLALFLLILFGGG